MSICWFCYRNLSIKKVFSHRYYKSVQSHDSSVSQVMQTLSLFQNRRLECFKTNISRNICIITGVIAVELSKRNIHMKFLGL